VTKTIITDGEINNFRHLIASDIAVRKLRMAKVITAKNAAKRKTNMLK
jgi:hypothetical protein